MSTPTPADYAAFHAIAKDLKRTKIGDRKYQITRRSTGTEVAVVVCVGEPGRDNYPWDVNPVAGLDTPNIGAQATLSEAIDTLAARLYQQERA